jgi:hypothetical protein
MTERRTIEEQRRLARYGFELEVTPAGKRYWWDPETGQRVSPSHAAEMLRLREEEALEEAGWIRTEVEGETYWCRPDSGRLYPRGAAYDLLRTAEEEG